METKAAEIYPHKFAHMSWFEGKHGITKSLTIIATKCDCHRFFIIIIRTCSLQIFYLLLWPCKYKRSCTCMAILFCSMRRSAVTSAEDRFFAAPWTGQTQIHPTKESPCALRGIAAPKTRERIRVTAWYFSAQSTSPSRIGCPIL